MKAPSKEDFMCEFGLEPFREDSDLALLEYIFESSDESIRLLFSFSLVHKSFQVISKINSVNVTSFSSECIDEIAICIDPISNGKCIQITGAYGSATCVGRLNINREGIPIFILDLLES